MLGSPSYAYSSPATQNTQNGPPYLNSESSKNTRIADEKRARKAVEEDAARLQNRVQTLQKEEQKAQKRLEETRLKAQDLLSLRARNEQKQLEREERYRQQQVRGHDLISTMHQLQKSPQLAHAFHFVMKHDTCMDNK